MHTFILAQWILNRYQVCWNALSQEKTIMGPQLTNKTINSNVGLGMWPTGIQHLMLVGKIYNNKKTWGTIFHAFRKAKDNQLNISDCLPIHSTPAGRQLFFSLSYLFSIMFAAGGRASMQKWENILGHGEDGWGAEGELSSVVVL